MENKSENIDTPIRVGKCVKKEWSYTTPQYPGYTAVRIHSMEREYGELSPYRLRDSRGRTIENLFIEQRIEKAKELLIYGEMTLSEIAFELSYSLIFNIRLYTFSILTFF